MPLEKTKTLLLFTLLGLLVGLTVLLVMPSDTPHSVVNEGYSGFSKLWLNYYGNVILSTSDLLNHEPSNSILILARRDALLSVEPRLEFIEKGGVIVTYGSPVYVVSFLKSLGYNVEFKGYVYDWVYSTGEPDSIIAQSKTGINIHVKKPYYIDGLPGEILVYTSSFAYVDSNGNGYFDMNESIASTPICSRIHIGNGYIVVVTAEEFLENSLIDSNNVFLSELKGLREILIDQAEVMRVNSIDVVRMIVKSRVSVYMLLLLLIPLALVGYYVARKHT